MGRDGATGGNQEKSSSLTPPLHPKKNNGSPTYNGNGLITQAVYQKIIPLPSLHKDCTRSEKCNHTPIWEKDCRQYQIFESLPYSVCVLDKDFGFAFANKTFLTWSGYTKSDLIGANLGDFSFYPKAPQNLLKKHLKNGSHPFSLFGFIPTPKRGLTSVQARWSCRFNRENQLTGFTCISFSLEELNNGAAVSYATKNGTIFAATKKLCDILNYSVQDYVKMNANDFYKYPTDRKKLFKTGMGMAVGEWMPTILKRKNGETIPAEVRAGRYEHIYRIELRERGSFSSTKLPRIGKMSPSFNGNGVITQTIDTKIMPLPFLCRKCHSADMCNRTPHWKKGCKQYQTFEVLPYTVATFDIDYRFTYINKAFLEWSGYRRSDIEGKGIDDFEFYPQNPISVLKKHVKAGENLFSWFGYAPVPNLGLTPLQAQWSCRFDAQGKLSGFTCMSFSLEELNDGAPVSYATCGRKALCATKKFHDIVDLSIAELLTENLDQVYVNPGDRDKLYSMIPPQGGAVGDWLPTLYKRQAGTTVSVEIRGGRYEHINRFEIREI